MTLRGTWCASALLLVLFAPAPVTAQTAAGEDAGTATAPSRLWIVAGGASTSLLGDCSDCEDSSYRHTGSVFAAAGVPLNRRTDFGGEVLFVPTTLSTGDDIRVTFLMATVEFRPWQSRGFLLRGGAGMAFVKNWLGTIQENAPSLRSKAFGLGLAAGWELRTSDRLGVQIFGAHHVAALGDLETTERTVENVMGNFWSVGAAIVIR